MNVVLLQLRKDSIVSTFFSVAISAPISYSLSDVPKLIASANLCRWRALLVEVMYSRVAVYENKINTTEAEKLSGFLVFYFGCYS